MNGKERMSEDEANAYMRKAVADMIQYCRIQVCVRAEMNEWAVESTGEFNRATIESDEDEGERFEAKHILFSCHVAEKLLGLTANDLALTSQHSSDTPSDLYGEYPETVKKLEALFNTGHRN